LRIEHPRRCIGWEDSSKLLDVLADAVRKRRVKEEEEEEE